MTTYTNKHISYKKGDTIVSFFVLSSVSALCQLLCFFKLPPFLHHYHFHFNNFLVHLTNSFAATPDAPKYYSHYCVHTQMDECRWKKSTTGHTGSHDAYDKPPRLGPQYCLAVDLPRQWAFPLTCIYNLLHSQVLTLTFSH